MPYIEKPIDRNQMTMHTLDSMVEGDRVAEKEKVVRFKLRPDREKVEKRMCISEHPFGTIKWAFV